MVVQVLQMIAVPENEKGKTNSIIAGYLTAVSNYIMHLFSNHLNELFMLLNAQTHISVVTINIF